MINTFFASGFIVGLKPIKKTSTDKQFCAFGVSIGDNPTAQTREEKYHIYNFVAWEKAADYITNQVANGNTFIQCMASSRISTYTNKDGNSEKAMTFSVQQCKCHPGKAESSGSKNRPAAGDDYIPF